MRRAIYVKTAGARATIAAHMLKAADMFCDVDRLHSGRRFDDCFEMGDGTQVKAELLRRCRSDEKLYAALHRHGFGDWLAELNSQQEDRESQCTLAL